MRRVHLRAALGIAATSFGLSAFVACGEDAPQSPAPFDGGSNVDAGVKDATTDTADAAPWMPPVACGVELQGPPLPSPESKPGYAEELAQTDASALPDPFHYGEERSAIVRSTAHYMFEESPHLPAEKSHAEALADGNLGRAVWGAAARSPDGGLDFPFLRRGLHHFYACSRPLPASLDELRARYGDYRTWTSETIDCSKAKNGPRRLYGNSDHGVYVAETVTDAGGIRETEVIFTQLRSDEQFDFAAYTEDGKLTDRGFFANGAGTVSIGAVPYICMTCHLTPGDAGGFGVLRPVGRGAGCKDRDAN